MTTATDDLRYDTDHIDHTDSTELAHVELPHPRLPPPGNDDDDAVPDRPAAEPPVDETPAPEAEEGARELSPRAMRAAALVEDLARCTDAEEERELREQLVHLHMGVAESIASRYGARGVSSEDLRQVAYLALTKAAQRFDAQSGHQFMSFCVPTIRGEVKRHFRDHGWMVRPPRRIQDLQHRLSAAENRLTHQLGRTPTPAELSRDLDAPLDDVLEALDCQGCFTPASLDRPMGEEGDGSPLGDLLGSVDAESAAAEARIALAPLVRELGERDRHIIKLRFYDGLTQREIAEDIGVTQMQVSRLLARIFRDLRRALGASAADAAA